MSERKSVLLRLDPAVHDALARWANDELRSTNAQIEFLLRRALADAGRLPGHAGQMRPAGGRVPAARPKPPDRRGTMTRPADTAAARPKQAPPAITAGARTTRSACRAWIYAHTQGWAVVVPALAWGGGIGAALLIGAAGLLPAIRAARMSPTEALWTV